MFRLFKKNDPIQKFWKWFEANEKRLRDFESNPDKVLNEVLQHAKKIQTGLAIEFELPKNGVINVTISADGNRDLFPLVIHIVDQAPAIEGWSFVAFRQRMPSDQVRRIVLKVQDDELDPGKMKFTPEIDGDSIDIVVYTENINDENYNQVAYAGLMLIDNILGEYDCVTKVRNYDFQELPEDPEEAVDLKPLLDLPQFVDSFHKVRQN